MPTRGFTNCLHVVQCIAAAPTVIGAKADGNPAGRIGAVGTTYNLGANRHSVQIFNLPDVIETPTALDGIGNHIEYDPSRWDVVCAHPLDVSRRSMR
jgi:hypothetical protein